MNMDLSPAKKAWQTRHANALALEAKLRQSMRGSIAFAARRQAKKGLPPPTVTVDQLMEKLRANNFRCALSRLAFYSADGGSYGPTRPSIDRIKPDGDYTDENTRVVLLGVNGLRGYGSDALMYKIAEALVHHKPRALGSRLSRRVQTVQPRESIGDKRALL